MIPISWLGIMLVHELGHVLGALATGGEVQRLVWHPLVISRTDVSPNPAPLVVVWMGPVVGAVVPLIVSAILSLARFKHAYLFWFFAGFCLIANGLYIGIGVIDPVGDARDMIRLGTPRWVLAAFGIPATIACLFIWHRVSGRFGFRQAAGPSGFAPCVHRGRYCDRDGCDRVRVRR